MALVRYQQMDNKLSRAIFLTVGYADIFDFPLTFDELYTRLVIDKSVSRKRVFNRLEKEKKYLMYKEGYYSLSGRSYLIKERRKRSIYSDQKYDTYLSFIKCLSLIPGVCLVAISGSLAVKNCDVSDDIDLFIIAEKNTMWVVRLIIVCILFLFNRKRSTKEKNARDKMCTNMFLSLDSLAIPKKKRSIYMAYEIGLMKVIVNKKKTYEQFIFKNRWARQFLPHLIPSVRVERQRTSILAFIVKPANGLLFYLQYHYMKKKITREKIGKNFAFFHPIDRESEIQKRLQIRLKTHEKFLPKKSIVVKSNTKDELSQVQIAGI